jgi:predicted nucleic acid-binding protein
MNVVIDASAAVSVALAMSGSEIFFAPLDQADLVLAPDIFVAEVCNAVWKYRKAELLPMEQCERALEHALSLPDQFESGLALQREAFALASRHIHPVYDALYLVLARRNNAAILTLDRRLEELARKLEIGTP